MTVRFEPVPGTNDSARPLLCCRMAALGLDREVVASANRELFERLRQRCAKCEFPDACGADLRDDPSNPVWEAYCPNSPALTRLAGS